MNNRPFPIKKTKSRGLSYDSNFFIAKDEPEVFPFCKYLNYKNTVLSKKNLPLHIKEQFCASPKYKYYEYSKMNLIRYIMNLLLIYFLYYSLQAIKTFNYIQ